MKLLLFQCRLEQAEFDSPYSCLGAIADTELGEDVFDVDFNGTHTDGQGAGDLAIGLPLGEQLQHLY